MARVAVPPSRGELLPPERSTIDPFLVELTDWMDTKFELPILRWRFGLDAVLGLIPGVGDLVTFLVSCYLLESAARAGVPRIVIVRMALNVAVDLVMGSIPILGDLLDVAWKANTRNLRLLRRTLETPPADRRRATWVDWLVVTGSFIGLAVALTTIVLVTWTALGWLLGELWSGLAPSAR